MHWPRPGSARAQSRSSSRCRRTRRTRGFSRRSTSSSAAQRPRHGDTMAGRECYHCKQWVEQGEPHNCWTTTEAALTADLSPDLRDAWERLRETAVAFGEQRIYASLNSIMFSRKACYCFVRPKTKYLEVCVFLGRTVKAPQIKRAIASSRVKVAHLVQVRHRDEVEAPLTDWMREAYEKSDALSGRGPSAGRGSSAPPKSVARGLSAPPKTGGGGLSAPPTTTAAPRRRTRSSQAPAPARSKRR